MGLRSRHYAVEASQGLRLGRFSGCAGCPPFEMVGVMKLRSLFDQAADRGGPAGRGDRRSEWRGAAAPGEARLPAGRPCIEEAPQASS